MTIDIKELNERIDRHEEFMQRPEAFLMAEHIEDLRAELNDALNESLDGNHRARCKARAMQKLDVIQEWVES